MKRLMIVGLACGLLSNGESLTIRLYNLANAPAKTIDRASVVAAQVLAQAGVAAIWEEGSPDSLEGRLTDMTPGGSLAAAGRREYLVVSIVNAPSADVYPGTLGYAVPFAREGAQATVFYDRLERLYFGSTVIPDLGSLLGAAIAHEIGHVLLGTNEHSARGIMKARWGTPEFQLLACKRLHFAPENASALRANVAARFVTPGLATWLAACPTSVCRTAGPAARQILDQAIGSSIV